MCAHCAPHSLPCAPPDGCVLPAAAQGPRTSHNTSTLLFFSRPMTVGCHLCCMQVPASSKACCLLLGVCFMP